MGAGRVCSFFTYLGIRRGGWVMRSHPLLFTWFAVMFAGGVYTLHGSLVLALDRGLTFGLSGPDLLVMFTLMFFVKSSAECIHSLVEGRNVSFLLAHPILPGSLILGRVGASMVSHLLLLDLGTVLFIMFDAGAGYPLLTALPGTAFPELILGSVLASIAGTGTTLEMNAPAFRHRFRGVLHALPFALVMLYIHETPFGTGQVAALTAGAVSGTLILFLRRGVIHEVSGALSRTTRRGAFERYLEITGRLSAGMNMHQRTIMRYEWSLFIRGRQLTVAAGVCAVLLVLAAGVRSRLGDIVSDIATVPDILASHLDLVVMLVLMFFGVMILGGVPALESVMLNRRNIWLYRTLPVRTEDVFISRARMLVPNMLLLVVGVGIPASLLVSLSAGETLMLLLSTTSIFLVSIGLGQILGSVFLPTLDEEGEASVFVLYTLFMVSLACYALILLPPAIGALRFDAVVGALMAVLVLDLSLLVPMHSVRSCMRRVDAFERV